MNNKSVKNQRKIASSSYPSRSSSGRKLNVRLWAGKVVMVEKKGLYVMNDKMQETKDYIKF